MQTIHRLGGSVAAAIALVATLGCTGEPVDDLVADDAQLAEATHELSIDGYLEGPLVLQESPLGEWLYERLSSRWTQWAMSNPWSTGPINDPTGAACAMGQDGPVWFLAGTSGGDAVRECTVPSLQPIFFPLVNYFNTPPNQYVDSKKEEKAYIDFFTGWFADYREQVCSVTLRVNGEDVIASQAELADATWVEVLDPFPVYMNEDNWGGGFEEGWVYKALTAGHYALLLLPPGDHTVELGGTVCWNDGETFDVGVVYELHVQP
jgi:hypothetical protein